ncbi:MAG: GNAT family N-acetyltransferase [Flavobacteriales bacterium]|jgi:GNAT superfamily N-acetyltransferase|nr:GNAT family N-acetyltransferase [Flavobacteriales bacterium]
MSFIVRKGKIPDMPQVLNLIKELAAFEKEPDAVIVTEKDLLRDGFKKNPLFKTYVAEQDGEIVGMALIYPRYSTWKGMTIHLEDLIVKKDKRGLGIGKALYSRVMQYAYKKKVKRVEWVVLDWNITAVDFYKSTGATILTDWHLAQMDEKALQAYINK